MANSYNSPFLSLPTGSLSGLDASIGEDIFRPGSSFLNVDLDNTLAKQLEDEKIKNATLRRELSQEKRLLKEAERELFEMKKYMFTDISLDFGGGGAGKSSQVVRSSLSPDVPSYTPAIRTSPSKAPRDNFSDSKLRQSIVSDSLDIIADKDLLLCDNDVMADLDIMSAKIFSSPERSDSQKRSRHNFGNTDSDSTGDLSFAPPSALSPLLHAEVSGESHDSIGGKITQSPVVAENAKRRADVTPVNIEELELWLKCKSDFLSRWAQQKADFLEKWNFCHEQFISRWMKEVSARFCTEDLYEYPIKCFIYHILSTVRLYLYKIVPLSLL